MLNESKINELVGSIVASHFSDERLAYEMGGKDLISDSLSGKDILHSKSKKAGEFGFISEAEAVMKFIALIHGTIVAIRGLYAMLGKQKIDIDSVRNRWITKLKEAGLDEAKANSVAADFSEQVLSIVEGG
jgi:hypothetical protein